MLFVVLKQLSNPQSDVSSALFKKVCLVSLQDVQVKTRAHVCNLDEEETGNLMCC